MGSEVHDPVKELFAEHGEPGELELPADFMGHLTERAIYGKHVVSASEIAEVHEGDARYFVNEGELRRAPIVMVGPTVAGRMLTVPIEPTGRWRVWRPVSAYESNQHHVDRYNEEVVHE